MPSVLARARELTAPEIAVFAAGTSSMGLEILAGRLVAPEFGSSIYTWGSIIGVFLAALSLGYYRGGRAARDGATDRQIVTILLSAAAYVAVVVLAGDLVLRAATVFPVPGRFAALLPVTLLFGPPVYLLGFISPYAAERSDRRGTGDAAGRVFALGTVGSILGAFATTFVLIPSLAVPWVGFVLGSILLVTAVGVALPGPDGRTVGSVGLVAVLLVGAVGGAGAGLGVEGDVVYRTQTAYDELRVVDDDGVRTLYLGDQRQSAMDLDRPYTHVYDYTRYFHLPLLLTEDVDRVLFIGGGGFTGPKIFDHRYEDVQVDVVEIDPAVVDAAERYFRLDETEDVEVITADGRQFLRSTDRTYDLIVLDAYRQDKVPFHLTTVEFFELARAHLDDDGVLLANVIAAPSGPGSDFFRAEYATMEAVFPQVYAFPTSPTGFVQNVELVATVDDARVSQAELRERARERAVGVDLSGAIGFYTTGVRTDDVPVLRDDRAPVAQLLDPMLGRKYVIERNGTATPAALAGTRPSVTGGA